MHLLFRLQELQQVEIKSHEAVLRVDLKAVILEGWRICDSEQTHPHTPPQQLWAHHPLCPHSSIYALAETHQKSVGLSFSYKK